MQNKSNSVDSDSIDRHFVRPQYDKWLLQSPLKQSKNFKPVFFSQIPHIIPSLTSSFGDGLERILRNSLSTANEETKEV